MSTHPLIFLAALSLAACTEDKTDTDTDTADTGSDPETDADFAARGEQAVGFTVLEEDGVTVKAWYPTASDAAEEIVYEAELKLFGPGGKPAPFLGAAISDAPPDTAQGPHPLVVLSHGFGMNPEWYHPLAEHLASHGFVVFGPEHVEYDWFTDVVPATAVRPLEVSSAIDLAASGALGGAADASSVAVIGHSYGGTTALMAGGARIHTGWMYEQCAANTDPFIQSYFCDTFIGAEADLADAMGIGAVPGGLWPSLADDRVDAIVAMAPDAVLFGEVGLAELAVPAMLVGGTGDTASPWSWGGQLAHDHISSETRALVAFEGAEHFIVTTTCDNMPWTAALPEEYASIFCDDPAWDKHEAIGITNEVTAAFLSLTLRGDDAGRQALAPANFDAVDGLEVRLSEAGTRQQ